MGRVELYPLDGQAVPVINRKYLFLLINRRSSLYVVGVNGHKGYGASALHPADGLNVMNLVTRDPDIVMPPMDPTPGMAYSPTIRVRVHIKRG
jgi:hypothetical protein